jgi:uncharacterized protein with FMN-binding domain
LLTTLPKAELFKANCPKIDLSATKFVPQQSIEKQSLRVDGVTGATITSQGIVEGAFQALKQAGLP